MASEETDTIHSILLARIMHDRAGPSDPLAGQVAGIERLRLLKIAARIVEMKTKIKLHLPTACPVQPALALMLTRTTRLVT